MKERRAEVVLKLLHPGGHDRFGDPELARSLGETLRVSDSHKGFNILQAIHRAPG